MIPLLHSISLQKIVIKGLVYLKKRLKKNCGLTIFLQKYVGNIKRKQSSLPKLKKEVKDLVIPKSLKVTLSEEIYIYIDDKIGSNERMVGFSTQVNLRKLFNFNLWLTNIAFKYKPKIF